MRPSINAIIAIFGLLLASGQAYAQPQEATSVDDPAAASVAAEPSADTSRYRAKLDAAQALASAADHLGASRALSSVIGDDRFGDLPAEDRRITLSMAAWAAIQLRQLPRARDFYLQATNADPRDPDDWYRLSMVEASLDNHDASARALQEMVEVWPELLDNLDDGFVFQLIYAMEPHSDARLSLLQALFDANWTNNHISPSSAWYELALMRIMRNQPEAARAAISRIESPEALIKIRSDRRFDSLINSASRAFDVEDAARRRVEDLRQHASVQPTRLELRTQLSYALLTAGLNDAVLALADEVEVLIEGSDEAPFTDMDERLWVANNRAIALRRLGRTDDALAALHRASHLDEAAADNVSQALNLGHFYTSLVRPDDAIAAVALKGDMSGYGRMVQATVRHRAALQKDDRGGAAKQLRYLGGHRKDAELIWVEALLDASRVDEAASVVIELLASPADRPDVLNWAQTYRVADPLPGDVQLRAGRAALLARTDVLDAVAKVGRIQRYDIYGDNGTE